MWYIVLHVEGAMDCFIYSILVTSREEKWNLRLILYILHENIICANLIEESETFAWMTPNRKNYFYSRCQTA